MALVIVKVGGSLLSSENLATQLRDLRGLRPDATVTLVVGGGPAADAVRNWAADHNLEDRVAHDIAIRSLSVTRCLVAALLPECVEVSDPGALHAVTMGQGIGLVDVEAALPACEHDPHLGDLPHSWDVTSDSIAAWLARAWSADELILAKSIDLPTGMTWKAASASELVDRFFPVIAPHVPIIRWCNLRSPVLRIEDTHRSASGAAMPTSRCRGE